MVDLDRLARGVDGMERVPGLRNDFKADLVCLIDVYPARERAEDFPGVSGLTVAEAVADAAPGREVLWLPTFDAAERVLRDRLGSGDLCLILGAGDVRRLGERLVAG